RSSDLADAGVAQPLLDLVPVVAQEPDRVLVEDVPVDDLGGDDAGDVREQLAVAPGRGSASLVPGVDVRQLHAQEGRLQGVEAAVVAEHLVVVLALAAVGAEHAGLLGDVVVVGGDEAAVAEGAEVLAGEEAVGAHVPHRSGLALAAVPGAERLRAVLDDLQAMTLGYGEDRVHLRGSAVEVHREDRLRARRDRGLYQARVDVEGAFVDVDEDRRGADVADRLGGGEEAERGRDDLVARADAEGAQADHERVGAAVDPYGVLHAQVVGDLALEGLHLGPADELAAAHDALEGGAQLVPELLDLGAEVEDGDGLGDGGVHAILRTSVSLTIS